MIKFALLGCGRIAKRHSELLGHNQIKGASLVAACDVQEAKARAVGEKFGIPWFTDMHRMMAEVEVDAISVLTESGLHSRNVLDLAPVSYTHLTLPTILLV